MFPRVVVTGMGIVCPLGVGVPVVWKHLIESACGIVNLTGKDYNSIPCKVAGFVPDSDKVLQAHFTKSELKNVCLSTRMAILASEEALKDAKWCPNNDTDKENTGVAVGVGMIDLEEVVSTGQALQTKGYSRVSPFFVPKILANMAAGHIGIRNQFQGPNHTVSTACTTGVHAIGDAFNFIRKGDAQVMVCGGSEAAISPLGIAAFSRMRALSTNFNHEPRKASRPFDTKRDGFVMGEGSGILVLENLEHARSRGTKIYAEVLGYGLSSDGYHVTSPRTDGKGAYRCMAAALKEAGVLPKDVGYINAHATSTPMGDEIEMKAIKKLFPDHNRHLYVSSTKGATGHLLGAAGAVEAIFTIMACNTGYLPPNLNLEEALSETENVKLVTESHQRWATNGDDAKRIALTNSFGFGGTNASLVIASVQL